MAKEKKVLEEMAQIEKIQVVTPVLLISNLDHPVIISYNGEGMIIAPRARRDIEDKNKLGGLPKGIVIISK